MREIPIPPDVQPVNAAGGTIGEPIAFATFFFELLNDPKATSSFAALTKSLAARNAMLSAQQRGQSSLRLEEADWEHVCSLLREPTGGFNPHVAYSVHSFMVTLLEAKRAL